ncbi:PREDICTED: general negative regulator of transcription subunit 3-like isoform X1 [Lupinus angustifolius]|uniref:general negative regulator of transcription subunit 3-like isoform X1 n=1 Tax=Lupinus angustifolius TaxID=3871 RepID=UPI00092F7304|nr:PREDICTED: general negative regulator of transcription subunit 3-like isoform X1 [Lupinus angustifolius]XP_019458351.1 PREDICTED: general negative regulator of transcription subunit 3-like isoform X1 [Lupinus angustifolius]XP_019458352.1 PREDICTED: general negative regulator of transcription subunit 3-like isoform X1 [Lupinus angustifolius]XP_019458353.1 PREDICTED: general negative regulator of transcription subunit 3-like isoform X1 [Lupinus angustifolius]
MGASRKLQGEIDRVLKKVQEGVEVFDSIWNKVYDTDNANQKEKFEADLKKEIKKLQRYRDQIKTWIQSSEIKDKKVSASYEQDLVDARKLIEREMERFKICEKETKTKAFSKEGLGQQPKTDPKEKAKSETRDWLNNVVGELESQIDSFEAELEGLYVKKGKNRPPRLTHLETSITRHKAHIKKCEFILRLLDNDELSPEEVNDVKDFLDDYVERNQDDFDDFTDVDELYSSLPLDRVETLEDLVTIPPGIVKQVTPGLLSKNTVATSASASASQTSEQADDTASQDSNSDIVPRTPPSKNSGISSPASTPTGNHATPVSVNVYAHNLSSAPAVASVLPGSNSVRNPLENTNAANSSSSINQSTSVKEEINSFPVRRPSPSLSDAALGKDTVRNNLSNQVTASIPLGSGNMVSSNGPLGSVPSASEITKRNMLGANDRIGSSGIVQPLGSPLSNNRYILPQAVRANDGTASADSITVNEAPAVSATGRIFSSPVVPGIQWRPGSPFPNQNEVGQLRARTEIAPDQREKFLQKFQQVQQQGHSTLLNMPSLIGGNQKQFPAQQHNPLLQQFNSQGSSVSSESAMGLVVQSPGLSGISSASLQQPPNSVHSPSSQQPLISGVSKDADVGNSKVEEQQQHQNFPDESATESTVATEIGKNLMNEDDLKSAYAVDSPAGVSASLTEPHQTSRDVDLGPGQPLQSNQPTGNLGVIGRRNGADLGAIGDNFSGSSVNSGGVREQLYNLEMLEAAYHRLPLPKDSERPRTYTPRHPTITPPSYPQVQAPVVNNPAFWERVGLEPFGTDTLFFAFYYQQNTYQQYLAAKELKKQSWRYHRKYNTWFQRHEEPKVATDEYEQGTYVYFDFHIANDDLQHGWCQRIKTEFTFEYNYLEDELFA